MGAIQERLRERLGPITTHVPDWKGSGADPLVMALRNAREGDVLGIRGQRRAIRIGTGDPKHDNAAYWRDVVGFRPIKGVAIVSEDNAPPAAIGGIVIGQACGGIDGLTLCGVGLETEGYAPGKSSKFCVLVENTALTGQLRIWGCDLAPAAGHETDWAGYGMMTGVRAEGQLDGFEMIGCTGWRSQEHEFCYVNNLGWRTGRPSTISDLSRNPRSPSGGSGRTAVQVVNRATATPGSTAGPSGKGPLRIERVDAFVQGGGGGGAITVAGHLGHVVIKDIRALCVGPHGGVVVYSDVGHGLHKNDNGYTTNSLRLENVNVDGGDRPHVAISGVERLRIAAPFMLRGNETCIDLWDSFGGPVDNGELRFVGDFGGPLSSYSGFASGAKVKYRDVALAAKQIDALTESVPA